MSVLSTCRDEGLDIRQGILHLEGDSGVKIKEQTRMTENYPNRTTHKLLLLAILVPLCTGIYGIGYLGEATALESITLSPTAGIPGSLVAVIGSGFGNNTLVSISVDQASVVNATASTSGTLSATITIPPTASDGDHIVTASDGVNMSYATFMVLLPVAIITPDSGIPGTTVTVSGSNFSPDRSINIKFDGFTISTIPPRLPSTDRMFVATFNIPSTATAGRHFISITDGMFVAPVIFEVSVTSQTITLSTNSGPTSTSVIVTGTGFAANAPLVIKLNSTTLATIPSSIVTTPSGSFTATITIPTGIAIGTTTISAEDALGRPASGLFTIIRSGVVTLSSNAGIAGSPITIFGSDFNPNSPITIRLGSTTLQTSPASLTTDALGSFETSIRIPNDGAVGSYTITVTDTSGRTGFGLFDVREPAFMTVSPTTGPPGTEVIVTGWNFVNGTRISIKLNSDYVATFPSEILGSELGKFIGKFRIPANHTEGTYTISAEDFTGRVGTTLFTVAKDGLALSLASNNGKGGTVSITGWGLSARSVVKISFDGEILDTIPLKIFTSPTGTFRASINVPGNAPNGNHTISAISNEKIANATLSLDRNYIDDRYGILISTFPQKYNFEVGETVLVSGRVLALANGFPLILKIINPNGAACSFQQLYLDKDMKFEAEPMKLGGKHCSLEGEYKITAYYGKGKALTKFNVAASDVELTGGRVEVMNAQMVLDFIRYDNKYTVDLDWATNAVRIRNNLNETIPFYLMFAEYDADEVTKKLSYTEVTLEPFEKSHIVAPFVPRIIDGKPNGYLHVFAWTTLVDPTPLNPGLYVPY